jgi:hypothetical protein
VVQQQEQTEQALHFAERWAKAELAGDTGALERMLAPDFMAVGPRGFLLNRDEWLARHQSRDLVYSSFNLSDVAARRYGPVTVLIGRQVQEASYQGHPVPLSELRVTLVLIQRDGGWRLAGLHLSPIVPS